MPDVGINLKMTENVSSVAPKVSSALRGISQVGEELTDSLDLGNLDKTYENFAKTLDKMHQIQKTNIQQEKTALPTIDKEPSSKRLDYMMGGSNLIRGASRAAASVGTGDTGAGTNDIVGTVGGLVSKVGVAGKIIAGVGALAFATNALSKTYEKHMTQIMDINSVLDRFGSTASETSENFTKTMDEISASSGRYAYTLQEGMQVYKSLIREAGTTTDKEARDVMFFGKFGGFDLDALSQFRGRASRFGMGDQDLLRGAYGTMGESGMPKGLFNEFMSSTLSIFEQGISRGIVRGFDEINEMQARIGAMGAQYQGQYGLNLLKQLDTRTAGATDLESQGDLILFQAARTMMQERGDKDIGYQDVMIELERGMNQDLLKSVYEQIKLRGGENQQQMIELLREVFEKNGMTYTIARDVLENMQEGKEIDTTFKDPGGQMRQSPEFQLLAMEEYFANLVRTKLGKPALEIKSGVLEETGIKIKDIENWLAEIKGDKESAETFNRFSYFSDYEENMRRIIETTPDQTDQVDLTQSQVDKNIAGLFSDQTDQTPFNEAIKNITGSYPNEALQILPQISYILRNPSEYPTIAEDLKEATNIMGQLPPEVIDYLNSQNFMQSIIEKGRTTYSEGEDRKTGGYTYTEKDLIHVLDLLTSAITDFNKLAREEKKFYIENIIEER